MQVLHCHMSFSQDFCSASPPANPMEDLIAVMCYLLRWSLDSSRAFRSTLVNPHRKDDDCDDDFEMEELRAEELQTGGGDVGGVRWGVGRGDAIDRGRQRSHGRKRLGLNFFISYFYFIFLKIGKWLKIGLSQLGSDQARTRAQAGFGFEFFTNFRA